MYEKAYAKWKGNSSSDQPDYGVIAGGDGYNALKELTGYRNNAINKGVGLDPNGHVIYTLPNLTDQEILTDLGGYEGKKLKNAAIALTRPKNAVPGGMPNGLYERHTYSILGKYVDGANNYLVLMNPYRDLIPVPEPKDKSIVANPAAKWENIIDLTLEGDGIFALLMSTFKQCFAYYAVVKPL